MLGKLTVICGPMFSSKSTTLIEIKNKHKNAVIFKPAMDNRYSDDHCVTHDGVMSRAISVSIPDDIAEAANYDLVCFDEIQFFDAPHFSGDIVQCIRILLDRGKDVSVCGLDQDWQGNAFPTTATLCALADEVIKTTAVCKCGDKATKTYKKTLDGDIVELGGSEAYESRCRIHWKR